MRRQPAVLAPRRLQDGQVAPAPAPALCHTHTMGPRSVRAGAGGGVLNKCCRRLTSSVGGPCTAAGVARFSSRADFDPWAVGVRAYLSVSPRSLLLPLPLSGPRNGVRARVRVESAPPLCATVLPLQVRLRSGPFPAHLLVVAVLTPAENAAAAHRPASPRPLRGPG